ncbi:MAG TPA: hypothetical protein VGR14_11785 [Verrucomicrobiae bacterium]|jgi:hypothetical protein|nr:hypothetical protein [Verrucomicrobiae bacterium]
MNAALRKEVRLLLPAWIVALVASTLPAWVPGMGVQSMELISCVIFAAGALLLSLSSFGLEMSFGTYSSLLAQPRPRQDTWRLKIGVLAVALTLLVVMAAFSSWLRAIVLLADNTRNWYEQRNDVDYFRLFWPVHVRSLLLLAVMAFAGGLWTTILFRQMVTAFWFSVLVPLVLYGAAMPSLQEISQDEDFAFQMAFVGVAACAYAVAGYVLARWLFVRAQDKQPSEATEVARWSFLPGFATPRRPVPVVALMVKELRLQDGTLVIAAVLVMLHLAALAALRYFPALASKYPFLNGVWMVWLVAPLLIGCACVAEERRDRTLEGALCLPVAKLGHFAIKLMVVFGLGILLGAVAPCLLEQLRPRLSFSHALGPDNSLSALILTATVITAIGCYASSLSGTLLQAFGAALGLFIVSPMVFAIFNSRPELAHQSWALSQPFLIAAFFFLTYANFKQLRITRRQSLCNGIVWLALVLGPPVLLFFANGIPFFIYYWKKVLL